MNYRTLPNSDVVESPDQLLAMLEAIEGFPPKAQLVYDDMAAGTPGHNPTIGYGFNLRVPGDLALVLSQITYNGANVFAAAAATNANNTFQTVLDAFSAIVGEYPGTISSMTDLETQLSNKVGSYFGLTPGQAVDLFTLNKTQASQVLSELINGYSVGNLSQSSIYARMSTYLTTLGVRTCK